MQNKNAGDYLEAIGRILTEKTEYGFTVEENEYGADLRVLLAIVHKIG